MCVVDGICEFTVVDFPIAAAVECIEEQLSINFAQRAMAHAFDVIKHCSEFSPIKRLAPIHVKLSEASKQHSGILTEVQSHPW